MKITRDTYDKIINSYPLVPPEQGGIIGNRDCIVCEYFHDNSNNIIDSAVYVPDVNTLNDVIEKWNDSGIDFIGLIHSHIADNDTLSNKDKEYIFSVFDALPKTVNRLYFPIVLPEYKKIIAYVARRLDGDITIKRENIDVF